MKISFNLSWMRSGRARQLQPARLNADLQKLFDALGEDCSGQEVLSAVRSAGAAHNVPATLADFGLPEWKIIEDFLATLSPLDRQAFILYKRPLSIDTVALELQLDHHTVIHSLARTYAGLSEALPRAVEHKLNSSVASAPKDENIRG